MKKRMMLIIPHEDDEFLVGGSALISFIRSKRWETKVVFVTNGDSRSIYEGKIRMQDSLKILKKLGLDDNDVIFLGYSNGSGYDLNIYNTDEVIVPSRYGAIETYGADNIYDYAYMKWGYHHTYKRSNLKNDLKHCMLDYMADVYLCVDVDKHEDHRLTSLIFEEILGEILRNLPKYEPLVLKKFAYEGVWFGNEDYYTHAKTQEVNLDNPYYTYESDFIRFAVPKDCKSLFLCNNFLYKAVKLFRTQLVWTRAKRFINDDICFWIRHTENIALRASVTCSSGNAKFINDFKIIDTSNVRKDLWDSGKWRPNDDDTEKKIAFLLKTNPKEITTINLYEASGNGSFINEVIVKLIMFDGNTIEKRFAITPHKRNVLDVFEVTDGYFTGIEVQISKHVGKDIGISEIEIYDHINEWVQYDLPLVINNDNSLQGNGRKNVLMEIEDKLLSLKEYYQQNIWIPKEEFKVIYKLDNETDINIYFELRKQYIIQKIKGKVRRK